MSRDFMDQLNEAPVTHAVLLVYLTMAYLTGSFAMDVELERLFRYGASSGVLVQGGQGWRIFSHAFLHGNLLHLVLNGYSLLVIGPTLERSMRTWRFLLLYVVSAASGCLLALFANPEHVPLVGGSGALFGMLGALVAYNIRGGRTLLDWLEHHGTRMLITMILFYLAAGFFIPVVSNSAHFGGLVGGFVLVFCFLDTGRHGAIDATGRAIQAGWIALLLSITLYQLVPVIRYDFNIKQYLREQDPVRKQMIQRRLLYSEGPYSALNLLGLERDPKTGIPGIALREQVYADSERQLLQSWKDR